MPICGLRPSRRGCCMGRGSVRPGAIQRRPAASRFGIRGLELPLCDGGSGRSQLAAIPAIPWLPSAPDTSGWRLLVWLRRCRLRRCRSFLRRLRHSRPAQFLVEELGDVAQMLVQVRLDKPLLKSVLVGRLTVRVRQIVQVDSRRGSPFDPHRDIPQPGGVRRRHRSSRGSACSATPRSSIPQPPPSCDGARSSGGDTEPALRDRYGSCRRRTRGHGAPSRSACSSSAQTVRARRLSACPSRGTP
jgi:hypothetical protein